MRRWKFCQLLALLPGSPPIVTIGGPTEIEKAGEEICWGLQVGREGGRGVVYNFSGSDGLLARYLEEKGGEGEKRVCVEGEDWENFEAGESYELVVAATSNVFGEIGSSSLDLMVKSSSSSCSLPSAISNNKRQQEISCPPDLWETDISSVYGIRTYPSGDLFLPSSIRSEGLSVMVKALTPCQEIDMSKEIFFMSSKFSWKFLSGGGGEDAEDHSLGSQLFLSSSFLASNFAPLEKVEVEVTADLGNGEEFSSVFSFLFLPGPVKFALDSDPRFVLFFFFFHFF